MTSDDLKQALSEDNNYDYIYLGNDITATSGFVINSNKNKLIIDGTYNNTKYTYTNNLSSEATVLKASTTNKRIILKNMNIVSSHGYGVVYVPSHPNYSNVVVEYNNINFSGIELSQNYYGTTKIVDSIIEVKDTNSVAAQRVCDSNRIIIDGDTTITSTSSTNTVFFFNDVIPSFVKIMSNSKVSVTTDREFMNGTNRTDLTVGHGAEFLLTTGNGFAKTTTHGARNVLVEEMANFTFIEKDHQRVPMWNVFGDFVVKEGASIAVLNTYMSTPSDNYNIYFKGTNQKFILDNPKYVNNFSFQNIKILTIGMLKINVHPITDTTDAISGHTIPYSNIKIEYNDKSLTATADDNGLFEAKIDSAILDNTRIKITSCLNSSFAERKVTTPFAGELTLLKVSENIPFNIVPSSTNPIILSKKNKTVITIVDSRINSSNWKLYINFINPMIEKNGKVLINSLFFKKFNNEEILLKTNKKLVYESLDGGGDVSVSNVTFSTDKGLFLKPSKDLLEEEDYSTIVIWSVEE